MDLKKLDIKTVFIIILSVGLIISFFVGQKSSIDYKQDEIKKLHVQNDILLKRNDSLDNANKALDKEIETINKKIDENKVELAKTQTQLQNLNKKKDETPNYINHLSANSVASELSKYIDKKK
jgi:peptidoglycan hydrolase CwlO-like protein